MRNCSGEEGISEIYIAAPERGAVEMAGERDSRIAFACLDVLDQGVVVLAVVVPVLVMLA